MAPMSLMTFEDARPWARAIKQKVVAREMPPWGADPDDRQVRERPSLSQAQIDTIAAWVDGGAPEGNTRRAAEGAGVRRRLVDRQAGLIFKMIKPFTVPADGTVPYIYVTIPTNLKEDIWIRGVELKPTDRRVVHHIISDLVEGNGKPADREPRSRGIRARKEIGGGLGGLVPGRLYGVFEEGVARKIPAGADIVLQMHYTTIGQPVVDQTEIGVDPREGAAGAAARRGRRPDAEHDVRHSAGRSELRGDGEADDRLATRTSSTLYPHMHVRGKDVTVHDHLSRRPRRSRAAACRSTTSTGRRATSSPSRSSCRRARRSRSSLHYDNSTGNRYNPDPDSDSALGRSDLGRDDDRLLRHDGRAEEQPGAYRGSAAVAIYNLRLAM